MAALANFRFFRGLFSLGGGDYASEVFLGSNGGFLNVGGSERAEVVGGLEAMLPGGTIHVGQRLHVWRSKEEVHRLALVDPFLASCGGQYKPAVVDGKGGLVLELEVFGDFLDLVELAVEVLQVIKHVRVPEAAGFEVANEVLVENCEFSGEVALYKEVLVGRFDTRGGASDVRDGRRWGDGHDVGIAHAVLGDLLADGSPVELAAPWHIHDRAPFFLEKVEGVLRKETTIPLGAFVALVGTALGCQVAGRFDSVEGDGLHGLVVEFDGFLGSERNVANIECIL